MGGMLFAHALFLLLVAGLFLLALKVGYPNISALVAIYAVNAVTLFEISTRSAKARTAGSLWRVGRLYAVIIGLISFYVVSDAYVLEHALSAYPADALWFLGFIGSVAALALVMSLRQPERADMFVLAPRFTGNGIGIFVVAISLQLFVMTAITPLSFAMIAFRLTFIAASIWFVVFGLIIRNPPVRMTASLFVTLNVLTAYLDLLWDYRTTIAFMGGAVALAIVTFAATEMLARTLRPKVVPVRN